MNVWRAWNGDDPWPWLTAAVTSLHSGDGVALLGLEAADPRAARAESNRLRLNVLWDFGGLWLDMDVIPLRRLTIGTQPWVAGLGRQPEGCCMYFPGPRHPFIGHCRDLLNDRPDRLLADIMAEASRLHMIRLERRVLPFDAAGTKTGVSDAWAVHLWQTSAGRL